MSSTNFALWLLLILASVMGKLVDRQNTLTLLPIRVGAIRWDNWNGPGHGQIAQDTINCMSPKQWHSRVPFCGRVINSTAVTWDCATPDVMKQELSLASRAGIKYWAFVQYSNKTTSWGRELSVAMSNYLAASDKMGVNFAALVQISYLPKSPKDPTWNDFISRYNRYFAMPEYEKVQDRPLVFLFGTYQTVISAFSSIDAFASVIQAWTSQASSTPHFVILDGYNNTFTTELRTKGLVQSRSSYALGDGLINGTFAQQMAQCSWRWKDWGQNGDDVIPLAALGWDPRDRATGCAPSLPHGEGDSWTQLPTTAEVAESIVAAVSWACANPLLATTQHILIYAWNENSEGGWLVPTLGEGTSRIDALHNVSQGKWSCDSV